MGLAKVAVELAKHEFIQAVVLLHPSFVTVDDIEAVEVPTAVLGAEFDQISPPALLKQFEEVLTDKSECAEEAHQNMLEWFAKYVKRGTSWNGLLYCSMCVNLGTLVDSYCI
ncbi:DLH domain-containing protein [Citrus sinensis]|uniref:DLH domain-containing protein n=1 Tax=Citrus sinensis TaxID=2711 RepID=A0ACB8I7K7_CITSI|nr:DLH domain-containing protein [Citrus sinensis]